LAVAKAIDWLKVNYDRAVLMAAAGFLFISCGERPYEDFP